jgi:hypothetical protein
MRVAADLAVAGEEADAVDDPVADALADAAEDGEDVAEGNVEETGPLGRIPHSCANSRRPVASAASNFPTQFAQVVIVVPPRGANGAQAHDAVPLHARDAKYAVKVEEH